MDRRPLKKWGQHFLVQSAISQKIVEALGISENGRVVEIGPGPGALVPFILNKNPAEYRVVEIDERWAADLNAKYGEKLTLHRDDFLKWPEGEFLSAASPSLLIGNIPYNITSPILFKMLQQRAYYKQAVMMMQKEVARRIVAKSGNKEYGILSVMLQASCNVQYLFDVGRGNFNPQPKVDSAVLRFDLTAPPMGIDDMEFFRTVVRTSFNQRRKMLRNSLSRLLAPNRLEGLDSIALDRRPESLSVDEFKKLASSLKKLL